MFIVLGVVSIPFLVILGPLLLESYDPVWETMTCEQMLDWSDSDAHDAMGDRGHMEFHNYYYDNCMNEEQVNIDDMTSSIELTESLGITDTIEVRNTDDLSIELVDSLGITDTVETKTGE